MELALNLLWAVLTVILLWLWVRHAPRKGASRWAQLVAMTLALWILFPVISLTDDLQSVQNPAEADSFARSVRRQQIAASPHPITAPGYALPGPAFSGLFFGLMSFTGRLQPNAPTVDSPALTSIQNRPPPAA
jgi:membrane-associated PAP2 superfamily phosphatase